MALESNNQPPKKRPIEEVKPKTFLQRTGLRAKQGARIAALAYGLGAAAGTWTGIETRDLSRKGTQYDPVEHAKLAKEVAARKRIEPPLATPKPDFKRPTERAKQEPPIKRTELRTWKEKWRDTVARARIAAKEIKETAKVMGGELKKWSEEVKAKVKEVGADPEKFIKETDMYKSMLLKYYDLAEVVDTGILLGSGGFVFLMLGGFVSRRLEKAKGDIVNRIEHLEMMAKINELVRNANANMENEEELADMREQLAALNEKSAEFGARMSTARDIVDKIETGGIGSITPNDVDTLRKIILWSVGKLPTAEELDSTLAGAAGNTAKGVLPPSSPLPPGMIRNKRGESL